MVKKGPCSHCRINSTPLWRNGPAEKPVLCNACGSRYKLKGHLHNYLPKHHKNYAETLNVEDQLSDHLPHDGNSNDSGPDFHNSSEQDFWNDTPTRKRTRVVQRQMTPMEKFHNQLLSLYKSEEEQSNESSIEEDILVYNVNNFIPSNEIGLGVVLLKTDPGSLSCSSSSEQAQPESSTTAP